MPSHAILTLDIGCIDGEVCRLTPAIHRLPPNTRIHPNVPEHPLVRVVETTTRVGGPLFHIDGAHTGAALRNAHALFTELAVEPDRKAITSCYRYDHTFQFWVTHYTNLDPVSTDELEGVVNHPTYQGRRGTTERKRYYEGVRLNTTPYIVFLGHRWEVNDGN